MGPMMPGGHPLEMLAECLAKAFDAKMGEIVEELKRDDNALRFWLRVVHCSVHQCTGFGAFHCTPCTGKPLQLLDLPSNRYGSAGSAHSLVC